MRFNRMKTLTSQTLQWGRRIWRLPWTVRFRPGCSSLKSCRSHASYPPHPTTYFRRSHSSLLAHRRCSAAGFEICPFQLTCFCAGSPEIARRWWLDAVLGIEWGRVWVCRRCRVRLGAWLCCRSRGSCLLLLERRLFFRSWGSCWWVNVFGPCSRIWCAACKSIWVWLSTSSLWL